MKFFDFSTKFILDFGHGMEIVHFYLFDKIFRKKFEEGYLSLIKFNKSGS